MHPSFLAVSGPHLQFPLHALTPSPRLLPHNRPCRAVIQYMPNFFFGALLLWFGIEISRDWLLLSFTKMTRIGGASSRGRCPTQRREPRLPTPGSLLGVSPITRLQSPSLGGAGGTHRAALRTRAPPRRRVRPAAGDVWRHHAVGAGGRHRCRHRACHALLCGCVRAVAGWGVGAAHP